MPWPCEACNTGPLSGCLPWEPPPAGCVTALGATRTSSGTPGHKSHRGLVCFLWEWQQSHHFRRAPCAPGTRLSVILRTVKEVPAFTDNPSEPPLTSGTWPRSRPWGWRVAKWRFKPVHWAFHIQITMRTNGVPGRQRAGTYTHK